MATAHEHISLYGIGHGGEGGARPPAGIVTAGARAAITLTG
jgi:hypothetical protein